MPWNPSVYNQFKSVRYRPFFDLMKLIKSEYLLRGIDIGCGTGEQTSLLAQEFTKATWLGIDASAEMLADTEQYIHSRLQFQRSSIENFAGEQAPHWDLIFSNAALQWTNEHRVLFPRLISRLGKNGQLAVQMPFQQENALNELLLELVEEPPFVDYLHGFRRKSPLLPIDEYVQLLHESGLEELDISLRVFPIIAANETELYNFIAGSALIPYMERLNEKQQSLLRQEFLNRIRQRFPHYPAIYSFKRILLYGVKK